MLHEKFWSIRFDFVGDPIALCKSLGLNALSGCAAFCPSLLHNANMLRVGSYPYILHGHNALGHLLMSVRDGDKFHPGLPLHKALEAKEDEVNSTRARTGDLRDTVREDSALLLEIPCAIVDLAVAVLPRLQSRDKGRHLNAAAALMPADVMDWLRATASPCRYLFAPQQTGRLSVLFVRLVPKAVRSESALQFPGQVVHPMPACNDDDLASEADWIVMDDGDDDAVAEAVQAVTQTRRDALRLTSSFDAPLLRDDEVHDLHPRRKRARLSASV